MPKTINLEPWEINLVLAALGRLPYDRVAATIQSITAQVETQEENNTMRG